MEAAITNGIKVSVITSFQNDYSSVYQQHFVYSYKITIENLSNYTVQLLRRKWFIFDANGDRRIVEGEGVIGQQPIIEPGQYHEYVSAATLKSEIGKMKGMFEMERIMSGKKIIVDIPEFKLVAPYRYN